MVPGEPTFKEIREQDPLKQGLKPQQRGNMKINNIDS